MKGIEKRDVGFFFLIFISLFLAVGNIVTPDTKILFSSFF